MAVYEFSDADNVTFRKMATSARVMALAGFGLGALLGAGGVLGVLVPPGHLPPKVGPVIGAVTMLGAAPMVWSARQLMAASTSIGLVATTEGHDVPHVVDAMSRLRQAFRGLVVMLGLDAALVAAVVVMLFPRMS